LGVDVVPDVNWIFTISVLESFWDGSADEEGLLRRVNATRGIFNNDQLLETGNSGRFEI
jgi:hypothetical protein